jgi:hypothetical protein
LEVVEEEKKKEPADLSFKEDGLFVDLAYYYYQGKKDIIVFRFIIEHSSSSFRDFGSLSNK